MKLNTKMEMNTGNGMQSDSIAYNNIQLLVHGRIRCSPDRLLPDRPSSVSEVRLPSSAGIDPDRTDSGASHLDEYLPFHRIPSYTVEQKH